MKKVILPLIFLQFLSFHSFAQEGKSRLLHTWAINFVPFGSGIVGEFPISKKSTIRAEVGGVLAISGGNISYTQVDIGLGFSLYGNINYRFYHLLLKNTEARKFPFNSGNYLFGQLLYYAPPLWKNEKFDFDSRASVGVGYGLQRVLKQQFVFSLGLGLGYYYPQKDVFFIGDLTLGILLKPRRKKKQ